MFDSFYDGPQEEPPLIRMALEQRCAAEGNWCLNRAQRLFYTFKLVVCIVLRRMAKPNREGGVFFSMAYFYDDPVTVAVWNEVQYGTPDGTEFMWDQVVVGHGLWADWRYLVEYSV